MLKITVYNTGYSSLLLTFLIGKSSQICYLRFTAENPRGFSRNETIAKHVMCNYMKTVITTIFSIISLVTFHFSFGQKANDKIEKVKLDTIDGVYIPKDLEDCFVQIDKMLNDSSRIEFKKISEEEFTAKTHFGLGIWIRN